MKSLARPGHPFNKFSTGSLQTLSGSAGSTLTTRELLLDFYRRCYSANLMRVTVLGKESLDVLQHWVVEKFSAVPNLSLSAPIYPSDPYGPLELSKIVHVVPVKYDLFVASLCDNLLALGIINTWK